MVPKDDIDVDVLDLDTSAADAESAFEPGEISFADVFNVGLQPERIYRKQMMHSIASEPAGFHKDTTLQYLPIRRFKIKVKKNYFVEQPSVVLFALENPLMSETTSTGEKSLEENEWLRVKFMRDMLKQGMISLLQLTEAGAESPWEEAVALIRKHLEPDVYEQTGAAWGTAVWNVFAQAVFDHSVEGEMAISSVSTE